MPVVDQADTASEWESEDEILRGFKLLVWRLTLPWVVLVALLALLWLDGIMPWYAAPIAAGVGLALGILVIRQLRDTRDAELARFRSGAAR